MKYNYNRLWKMLIDKGMTKTEMRKQAGISTNVLAKMGRCEPASMESLAKVCTALNCGFDDVVEMQEEGKMSNTNTESLISENRSGKSSFAVDSQSRDKIPGTKSEQQIDAINNFNFSNLFTESIQEEHQYNGNSLAILGDCLSVMKKMKDKSINLIFADPPYNIGKDFGNNADKWKTVDSYISWCKEWIDECMRVLSDTGTMYFMTATQHMPYLDVYVSEKYNVLCRIVWTYDSSGVQSKKMYGSLYEPILMVNKSNSNKYTFNYQDIMVEAKTGAKRKLIDYRKNPPQPYNTKKVPGNVWNFSRVRFRMDEYENHPTQKPEALLERIIRASSNPGDVVLDPFSGSFTTSAVAARLGRNGVGIDLNDEYYEIGLRRTNIANQRNGKSLEKIKVRKTKAKSKYVRGEK